MSYELKHIAGNTFVLSIADTCIGMYRFGKRSAVMIDTGWNDQEIIMKFLHNEGIRPVAVINTHLHVDHIGCNELLKEEFECEVYASADEIRHEIEEGYIDGQEIVENPDEGRLTIEGFAFEIIRLPGHSRGHQGIATPDGVCFLGDAIMSEDILENTRLPYHYEMAEALQSMEKIKTLDYPVFVLSHNSVCNREELVKIADANIRKEELFAETIEELSRNNISREKLTMLFMDEIGISKDKQNIDWVWETAEARVKEK
ncbi:MAG: MBL fold metallo-hydrolase [Clostridia bacterium]|nr:MBL fold metallo-hydrolase [Clostridia bacterium]